MVNTECPIKNETTLSLNISYIEYKIFLIRIRAWQLNYFEKIEHLCDTNHWESNNVVPFNQTIPQSLNEQENRDQIMQCKNM